ncbi:MAG: glycosyltransferase [Cyanobacteria bacterium J06634_5]
MASSYTANSSPTKGSLVSSALVESNPAVSTALQVKVLVLRGGGGHYSTYLALKASFAAHHPHWQLAPVFVDSLGVAQSDPTGETTLAESLSRAIGTRSDKFYDFILKNGFGWVHLFTLHLHKLITWLKHSIDVALLVQRWQQQPPDLVLSVVPFHNRALAESLKQAKLNVPVVTILTDFADSPPAYWAAPQTQNYLLCPTQKAVGQAIAQGVLPERVIKTSGLVIHPHFYKPQVQNIAAAKEQLGLVANRVTALVFFGANGSDTMLKIANKLAPLGDRLQLIFLCGRNQKVATQLNQIVDNYQQKENQQKENLQKENPQKIAVVEFTSEVSHYMHLSDFFIGKPGNVSISEAVAMQLPLIVERNLLTLNQERYAADWIEAHQIGLTVSTFRDIYKGVNDMIKPDNFVHYQANLKRFQNRAVFEVPQVLEKILDEGSKKSANEQTIEFSC